MKYIIVFKDYPDKMVTSVKKRFFMWEYSQAWRKRGYLSYLFNYRYNAKRPKKFSLHIARQLIKMCYDCKNLIVRPYK